MNSIPTLSLRDGNEIPVVGFGTWTLKDDDGQRMVETALEIGYRHIDTAEIYKNEDAVGRALAAIGLARDDLFVTSKVWHSHPTRPQAREAIERSLEALQLDHVDLYLVHWPYGENEPFIETWDALQEFKAEGLATSIGVSNFHPHHLDRLNGEVPVINQVELHPYFNQQDLRDQMASRGIAVESYTPLGRGELLKDPVIIDIAHELGVTPGQVVLRWHVQHGLVAIPRTKTPERAAANLDVFSFALDDDHMARIDSLTRADGRTGQDPDTATF